MSTLQISEDNPFLTLITETNNDADQLQSRYENHRVNRNAQQAAEILAPDFAGWDLDEILMRLDGPTKEEGFVDPRNCLVIWARPPSPIRDLVEFVQSELRRVAPTLWFMPPENLHTTVLEIAHSLTEEQIEGLVNTLESSQNISSADIADHAFTHRTRLVKPMVGFDSAAMALTFVPAAGEASDAQRSIADETYTHLTIARFVTQDGFVEPAAVGEEHLNPSKVKELIDKIEEINQKLQDEDWPSENGTIKAGGEWLIGQEKGLAIRRGRLWYGGGNDVQLGKGY
ncbi:hypothetical protein KXW29_006767 [Aspergillus fumigatus]|nr:hypothetical protein KXW29_006767 [Aspergillus fumigatus]